MIYEPRLGERFRGVTTSSIFGTIRLYKLHVMGEVLNSENIPLSHFLNNSDLSGRTFNPTDRAFEIDEWMHHSFYTIENAKGIGSTSNLAAMH